MSTQYQPTSVSGELASPSEPLRTTLLENEEVLVVTTAFPGGTGVPTHTHRFPSVAYVVEGGTLETTTPDGTVERYDVRPGETLWSATGHAHSARNVGPTPIRIVEVEVKHAAPSAHAGRAAERVLMPADLEWKTDPFDPRRASALLVGDPTKPGAYAVRFRAPAGYAIGLHVHPDEDEQLTVVSGAIRWSTGNVGSGAPVHELTAGGFAFAPAGTPHRVEALEDCVLQMSGVGPRTYVYLDEEEDPRRSSR